MKHLFFTILIALSLMIALPGCGGNGNGKKKEPSGTAAKEQGADNTCKIDVVFSDQEEYNPGPFVLKKCLAYISGMSYSGGSTAKIAYVVFANYEARLGLFSVDMPRKAGQTVILLSFKTGGKVVPMERQVEEYAKMEVPTGGYQPCWMGEGKCFQVTYFVGGQSGGPSISGDGASGTAALTVSTPTKLSGTIDFTSPNGSTIKGTFNLKVEKDMWKK